MTGAALLPALGLGLACLALLVAGFRLAWKPVAIALAIGLAGYGWQAPQHRLYSSGAVPARPVVDGPTMIAARQTVLGGRPTTNRWIVIADAMARHGQFSYAAEVLQGAVTAEPNSTEAWLAMGDALYGHDGGGDHLSHAAVFAYDRADAAAERGGGAPWTSGTAMLMSGRKQLAAEWWQRRLRLAPGDAPWRPELHERLDLLISAPPRNSGESHAP